jgi:hypothetical protein
VYVYVYVYVCVHVCVQSCSHSHVLRRRRSDVSVFVGRETAVVKSSRITTKTIRKKERPSAPGAKRILNPKSFCLVSNDLTTGQGVARGKGREWPREWPGEGKGSGPGGRPLQIESLTHELTSTSLRSRSRSATATKGVARGEASAD